jgi:arylsulfatase A-like enzyme
MRMIEMGLIDKNWLLSERDSQVTPWDDLDDDLKQRMDLLMSIYAAQVDCMDQGVGKVLSQLESMGAADNTLVMFLSDNVGSEESNISAIDISKLSMGSYLVRLITSNGFFYQIIIKNK